jgi:uncharacterized protein (TIGR02147 family)
MKNRPTPLGYLTSQSYVSDFDRWAQKYLRNYSRRAFAKWAGLRSPNFLTLIISGKRHFHLGWLEGFIKAAKLSSIESRYLNTLVRFESSKNPEELGKLHEELRSLLFSEKITNLQQKDLYLISTPEVWSVYIALNLKNNSRDQAQNIKSVLGIEVAQLREIFKKFKQLELVSADKNGHLEAKYKFISTENEFSRIENQKFHLKVLGEATEKLQKLPAEHRSFGSLTILLSRSDFASLQNDLQEFGKNLLKKYGDEKIGADKNIVARINLQLYPLNKEFK